MSSVDVLVPCYRYGHFLGECVESVLAQSGPSVRVLIIDDASPDNTAEVADDLAKRDSRVTFLQHITNQGHIVTYNEGIAWASADYLLLLSADDYLLPGALIELSGGRNIVLAPAVIVRTELQKKLGGYRPELPHSGDMEMWLRLAAYSSVGALEAYQAVYRRHAANMSLAYTPEHDLQQRKAALDFFLQTCGDALPNAEQLHRRLFWSLGCQAVQPASRAFNEGKMELSERLSEFALAAGHPESYRRAVRCVPAPRGLGPE
jgi:glycosyltransferase involved in cell wall biosynthesis